MDFNSFMHMGGYALNVWGSYGLGILGYGALLAYALMKLDRLRKQDKK